MFALDFQNSSHTFELFVNFDRFNTNIIWMVIDGCILTFFLHIIYCLVLTLSLYLLPFAMPGKPLDPPPLGCFIDLGNHLLRISGRTGSFSSVLASLGDCATLCSTKIPWICEHRSERLQKALISATVTKSHGFSFELILHIKSFGSGGRQSSDEFIVMCFFFSLLGDDFVLSTHLYSFFNCSMF